MYSIWDDVYPLRWKWAERAEAELKQNLSKLDADEYLLGADSHEITIGVYGPTQVGKTTLILRLLGIGQERIAELSHWLRGKRRRGNSATVTAMQYKRSDDSFFHLYSPAEGWQRGLSGPELEQALADVRRQVEEQGEISTDSLIIEIANTYFIDTDAGISLHFIDLPGVQSAEESERKQVEQCTKRWLPICELILLVDDATQLTAFTQIEDRNVRFWMDDLSRFRLVLTHALTLESVMRMLTVHQSKDTLRHYYAGELSRMLEGSLSPASLEKVLYPIDIGHTLQSLQKRQPDMHERMAAMMEELLCSLRRDLQSQKPAALHFKRLATLYREAERCKNEEMEQLSQHLNALKEMIEKQEEICQKHRGRAEWTRKKHERETEPLREIVRAASTLRADMQKVDLQRELDEGFVFPKDKTGYKASYLRHIASEFQYRLESMWNQKLEALRKKAAPLIPRERLGFSEVMNQITVLDPVFDQYLLKKNYERDWQKVKASSWEWAIAYLGALKYVCRTAIKECEKRLELRERKLARQKEIFHQEAEQAMALLYRLRQEKEELEQRIVQVQKEWEQEKGHCQSLEYYFQKHALQAYQELCEQLKHGTLREKWQAQHRLQFLRQDSRMVLDYLAGRGNKYEGA